MLRLSSLRPQLWSLRYRIVLSIVVIEVVMLSILVWSNTVEVERTHAARLVQSSKVILQQFTSTVGGYIIAADYATLTEYARTVLEHDELEYIHIEDASGRELLMVGTSPEVWQLNETPENSSDGVYNVAAPIDFGGRTRGTVHMGFSLRLMDATVQKSLRRGAAIASVEVVLSVIAALLLGFVLTRNLKSLSTAVERYSSGEPDVTAPVRGRDEVAQVARAFNTMVRDRARDEAARRKSEASLRTAQRIAHLGSWEWEIGSDFVEWSDEMYRILDLQPGEVAAKPDLFYSRVHPDDLEMVKSADETAALVGKGHGVEFRVVHPDGTERVVLERTEVSYDMSGKATHMSGTVLDITERRQAEEQLRQAQKMESIGQLTGGVAHDFNNLLGVIQGNAELLADQLKMDDPKVQTIIRSAKRGGALTHRLLAFSRKQALRPVPVSANKLIRGMLDMLRRSLGKTVEIEVVGDAGLWLTEIDPGQLENAILNLAINARDAMPDGGKLTIETSNARMTDKYAAAQAEVEPGQYVLIAVTDSGSGMPPEVRDRVFEPFFTTKDVGKGTGLGLSMVFGFVKQSGGHVTIYSEVGEGTTIKLYLPRYWGARAAIDVGEPTEAFEPAKGEVILVVEDDTDLQTLLVNLLRSLNYEVLPSATGEGALEALQQNSNVNLLLTDVVLPGGMSGSQLAGQAQELHPSLPVLYMSGYTNNAIIHDGRLDQGVQLLEKPFSKAGLARKVREALDQTKP